MSLVFETAPAADVRGDLEFVIEGQPLALGDASVNAGNANRLDWDGVGLGLDWRFMGSVEVVLRGVQREVPGWTNRGSAAYSIGNTFHPWVNYSRITTGCAANGRPHPEAHLGADSGLVAMGTLRHPDPQFAPLGPVRVTSDYPAAAAADQRIRLLAISPVITVVPFR